MSYRALTSSHEFRIGLGALLGLAFAFGSEAQPAARQLHIALDEEACRAVTEVSVVYNYDDTAYRAENTKPCHWKYDIPTFMTTMPFSLRLNGAGRTRCKRATPSDDRAFTLTFSMPDTDEAAKDIRIGGKGLRYVRDVPVKWDGDVPCFEVGPVPGTLFDVQFDIEDVRVQIFKEKKLACGVLVDDIWAISKAKNNKLVNLTSKELAEAVERQGVRGALCHTPSVVPFVIIQKNLGESNLSIEVK